VKLGSTARLCPMLEYKGPAKTMHHLASLQCWSSEHWLHCHATDPVPWPSGDRCPQTKSTKAIAAAASEWHCSWRQQAALNGSMHH